MEANEQTSPDPAKQPKAKKQPKVRRPRVRLHGAQRKIDEATERILTDMISETMPPGALRRPKVRQAAVSLRKRLERLPVHFIGAERRDGKSELAVYLTDQRVKRRRIPGVWEGYPVFVRYIGRA